MTTTPRLIGLTGKAGAGKDTVAEYLNWGYTYDKVAFADPLRKGIAAIFDLHYTHFQHPRKEETLPEIGKSPRQLMQTLGTEWGRELVHPDLWLILAKKRVEDFWTVGGKVVITDVRFENEATMIRELGGVIWHIKRAATGTPHQHLSEAGVGFGAESDVMIDNNKSIDDLHILLDQVLA